MAQQFHDRAITKRHVQPQGPSIAVLGQLSGDSGVIEGRQPDVVLANPIGRELVELRRCSTTAVAACRSADLEDRHAEISLALLLPALKARLLADGGLAGSHSINLRGNPHLGAPSALAALLDAM